MMIFHRITIWTHQLNFLLSSLILHQTRLFRKFFDHSLEKYEVIRMRSKFVTIIVILHLCVTLIEQCPLSCRCFIWTRLTLCEGKNLHKVPLGIPAYTVRLVLSGTNISRIRTHDFMELSNLRWLTISDSPLAFFDTEVLKKFKNLVGLSLERNQLRNISNFPPHMKLKSLRLLDNLLTLIARKRDFWQKSVTERVCNGIVMLQKHDKWKDVTPFFNVNLILLWSRNESVTNLWHWSVSLLSQFCPPSTDQGKLKTRLTRYSTKVYFYLYMYCVCLVLCVYLCVTRLSVSTDRNVVSFYKKQQFAI